MIEQFNLHIDQNIILINHNRCTPHPVGSAYLSLDNNFCYVNIPKNSSSTIKDMTCQWTFVDFRQVPDNVEFIVILRDPIQRFVSAVSEFLAGRHGLMSSKFKNFTTPTDYKKLLSLPIIKDWIFNTVYLDAHCLPQSYYLQGLPVNKTYFFNQGPEAIKKIAKMCNLPYTNKIVNKSTSLDKKIISNWVLEQLECRDLAHIINVHYWCDHQLLDFVEFH